MRKRICFVLIITLPFSCGPKNQKVEKYMEDGVEVIVNPLEPYNIKGEPSTLHLEEEFTIDSEKDDIAEIGLVGISTFAVDSWGNIYLFQIPKGNDNLFYKFDSNGNFVTSFGHRGQGPNEVQMPSSPRINNQGEILILDKLRRKSFTFSKDGSLINEIPIEPNISEIIPLENGKYLIIKQKQALARRYGVVIPYRSDIHLAICNFEYEETKELDRFKFPDPLKGRGYRGTSRIFGWSVSSSSIFVGNGESGYQFWRYDLEGNLLRKIKKDYTPIKVTEDYKRGRRERIPPLRKVIYFPTYMLPFQYFFTDDNGRLFVMTFEKGDNPKEYIYDIFNPDGIFIGRTSLDNYEEWLPGFEGPLHATAKNNRLYCLREKESGYKELVVYKMKWE